MPNPIVAVRGEAVIDAEPETARIKVTVTARDKDRSLTLTRLGARMDAVREVLDAHPDAIERRETGHLVVYPESRSWLGGGERVGAYTGSGSTAVVITDFTLLGEILVRADAAAVWTGAREDLRFRYIAEVTLRVCT